MSTTGKREYDAARYQRQKAERPAAPPNPIELLTNEERAYIAGLIDGEGSIMVMQVGPLRRESLHPVVCVTMSSEDVLRWLGDRIGVGIARITRDAPAHYRQQWSVRVTGTRARLLCVAMLPYLHVKHRQAEAIKRFPIDARRGRGVPLSDSVRAQRREIRDEVRALNGRARAA